MMKKLVSMPSNHLLPLQKHKRRIGDVLVTAPINKYNIQSED
jgi:hypothetical protein